MKRQSTQKYAKPIEGKDALTIWALFFTLSFALIQYSPYNNIVWFVFVIWVLWRTGYRIRKVD